MRNNQQEKDPDTSGYGFGFAIAFAGGVVARMTDVARSTTSNIRQTWAEGMDAAGLLPPEESLRVRAAARASGEAAIAEQAVIPNPEDSV